MIVIPCKQTRDKCLYNLYSCKNEAIVGRENKACIREVDKVVSNLLDCLFQFN